MTERADPHADGGKPRQWPARGPFAAAYRVMFPLAALWGIAAVALWQWGPGLPVAWHVHEMTFGFGGAAMIGYHLAASPSWTGRAPPSGLSVAAMMLLWLALRCALLAGTVVALPALPVAALALAVFWLPALVLLGEARRAGRPARLGFVSASLATGLASAAMVFAMTQGAEPPLWLAPAWFGGALLFVAGRMAPAFLARAAGLDANPEARWRAPFGLVLAGGAALAYGLGAARFAGAVLLFVAGFQLVRLLGWPLAPLRRHLLLVMLVTGFVWLIVGIALAGAALLGLASLSASVPLHALAMGSLGALVPAVGARAFARRLDAGLTARRGTALGFALVQGASLARLFDATENAAGLWVTGFALLLATMMPGLRGAVPRPIFSGRRIDRGHGRD